jgi:hypothetical protein
MYIFSLKKKKKKNTSNTIKTNPKLTSRNKDRIFRPRNNNNNNKNKNNQQQRRRQLGPVSSSIPA